MVVEWIKEHWEIVVIAAIVIAGSFVIGFIITRPMPVPPGY